MKKWIIAFAVCAFSATTFAKTLTFGTESTYPPFEFYNAQHQLTGFDIDIANRICELSQRICVFKTEPFDSLIPSLKTRRIDAAISGIDITQPRSEQVDFSHSYYQNSATFIAKKGRFQTIEQLKNKRIGVQNGTTHQRYLMNNYPDMQIINYDSYQYAVLDLDSGRIDGIFSDSAVSDEWLASEKSLTKVGSPVTDPDYFGAGFAIALRKGNTPLLDTINHALKEMHKDGSYEQIYTKWFANH